MNLLSTIKTKEDISSLMSFIDMMEQGGFRNHSSKSRNPKELVADLEKLKIEWGKFSWFDSVLKSFNKNDGENDSVLKELLEVKKSLSTFSEVKIAMSFHPSETFLNEIYDLFKKEGLDSFVIDSFVDKEVKTGAKVYFKGKYLDATLKNRVFNLLMSQNVVGKYL